MAGSPLLGFGSDGAQTLYDLMLRPRPAGGASALPAVGPLDAATPPPKPPAPPRRPAPTAGSSPDPATRTSSYPSPPSRRPSPSPCSATPATPTAPGGLLPTMDLLSNPTLGLGNGQPGTVWQTITDTGPASQWNTLTSAPFTPTGDGRVTVRVWSDDASGVSVVNFAVFAIT